MMIMRIRNDSAFVRVCLRFVLFHAHEKLPRGGPPFGSHGRSPAAGAGCHHAPYLAPLFPATDSIFQTCKYTQTVINGSPRTPFN